MNREKTKKIIEVMQAYVDGAEIQQIGECKSGYSSSPVFHPRWGWNNSLKEYRIKPKEPREFWIQADDLPQSGTFGVRAYVTNVQGYQLEPHIKVREVL